MSRSRSGPLIMVEDDRTTIYRRKTEMSNETLIDIVAGLVMSQKGSIDNRTYRILVPAGTDLLQVHKDYETLEDAIKKIDTSIKSVELAKDTRVSIERIE